MVGVGGGRGAGDPLRKRLLRHSLKSKTNNFKLLLGQITNTINTVIFLVCVIFQFKNELVIII